MRTLHLALLSSLTGLVLVSTAAAQPCTEDATTQHYCGVALDATLGGPAGYGPRPNCLGPNDDGSGASISLTPVFPSGLRFYTGTQTSMVVNTNGNITFAGALPTFTPDAFPVAARPMIAPFWADVDIRRTSGTCINGVGTGTASITASCANDTSPDDNSVWWELVPPSGSDPGRVVVTWLMTEYYDSTCSAVHNRRMSFQLILTPVAGCGGAGDFDVEFRYNRCDWETGNASGGTSGFGGTEAQAGFDAGNNMDYVEILGSREPGIARILCEESNVMEPGIWRYQIRSGVVLCPDAGMACTVSGAMGACAMGRTNCVGGGTECVQQVMPSAERCDNLDNDCDGTADEEDGMPLCPGLLVCIAGACVDGCFEGTCPGGLTCTPEGRCVDPACASVTCDPGERCVGGACVPACAGVVCPHGESCVSGRCVDGCAGITCDDCTVCVDGACAARCDFAACPAGSTCEADGRCVSDACVGVSCSTGTYCDGGACIDSCTGVTCPFGEMCTGGACIPAEMPDAAVERVDAAFPPGTDAGEIPLIDAASGEMDGGTSTVDTGPRRTRTPSGCCRVVGAGQDERESTGVGLVMLVLAGLVAQRRRRR